MRILNKWLLPVLTGLVVLAAVLLPQQLSQVRDGRILGQVHTEALAAENGFTALPPELMERIALLARWQQDAERLAVASQELENWDDLRHLAVGELRDMADQGVFPPELLPEDLSGMGGWRLVLQDLETGAGASFLIAECYEGEQLLWMAMDEESGRTLLIDIGSWMTGKLGVVPADVGAALFDRLGVPYELLGEGTYEALFRLTETDLQFIVSVDKWSVSVRPMDRPGSAMAVATDRG